MTRTIYIQITDTSVARHFTRLEGTIGPAESQLLDKAEVPRDSGIDLPLPLTHVCQRGSVTKLPLGVAIAAFDQSAQATEPWTPLPLLLIVRSSTVMWTPLRQANAPGLIDSGYRGTLMAVVDNISQEPYRAEGGTRYFQILACDGVPFDRLEVVDELPSSARGDGGFGSTGK